MVYLLVPLLFGLACIGGGVVRMVHAERRARKRRAAPPPPEPPEPPAFALAA